MLRLVLLALLLLQCQARDVIQAVENPHMQVGCSNVAAAALSCAGWDGCASACVACLRRDKLTA